MLNKVLKRRDDENSLVREEQEIAYVNHSNSVSVGYGSIERRPTGSIIGSQISKSSVVSINLSKAEPVVLSWENLNVHMPAEKKLFGRKASYEAVGKHILKNVSGIICPGQLVALMGASGAGKTTLMNTLTGRNRGNLIVEGHIKVNGEEIGEEITSISAYVQQEDLAIGTLSVREHLIFQALLRLPKTYSREEKIERVDEVIFELGLLKCKDTKIGVPGVIKGISGGEAKRLAFASEILTNPQLLFCDEPTTGLDSFMAENVVGLLQALAGKGKTILCTIQQPPSEVYTMFDRVLFMAEGRTAYLGKAKNALQFFQKCGHPCPLDFNPGDHFIQTLAVIPGREAECRDQITKICDEFLNSKYAGELQKLGEKVEENKAALKVGLDLSKQSTYKTNWFFQFMVLLWRSTLNNYRNRTVAITKLVLRIAMGLFIGLVYFHTRIDQRGIMNIDGALFFFLQEVSLGAMYGVLFFFSAELPVLCREHHDGMYKVSSYYLSKVVSFMPVFSVDGAAFVLVAYWMVGLRQSPIAFLSAIGICVLVEQAAVAFGCLISAASPSVPITLSIIGPIVALFQMLGGLYANVETLPAYIAWLSYLSWFRTGYSALTINQWHGYQNISCPSTSATCLSAGDDVLKYRLSFDPGFLPADLCLLVTSMALFHLLGYLALWRRVHKMR